MSKTFRATPNTPKPKTTKRRKRKESLYVPFEPVTQDDLSDYTCLANSFHGEENDLGLYRF
jgi:hypothetical protein